MKNNQGFTENKEYEKEGKMKYENGIGKKKVKKEI